jgi:ferredoxin
MNTAAARKAGRCKETSTADDAPRGTMSYNVWIDQDLCTGDGICAEIAPEVFTLLDDGLAYVKDGDGVKSDPGGPNGLVAVPDKQLDGVIESAEECPGECIFIEAAG